jgi:hypothetical protein
MARWSFSGGSEYAGLATDDAGCCSLCAWDDEFGCGEAWA